MIGSLSNRITNLYNNLKRYVVSNKSDKSGRELETHIDIHLRKIERWFPSGIKRAKLIFCKVKLKKKP